VRRRWPLLFSDLLLRTSDGTVQPFQDRNFRMPWRFLRDFKGVAYEY
jgi:hypothetical protein